MIILLHLIRKVRITSPELQPMAVQYTDHVVQTEEDRRFMFRVNLCFSFTHFINFIPKVLKGLAA